MRRIARRVKNQSGPESALSLECISNGLEEAHWFGGVADQQVFGLLIMIKHHFVVFTANA